MDFKLAVYVKCPACGGSGHVPEDRYQPNCTAGNCDEGYRVLLVTPEAMKDLLSGQSTLVHRQQAGWEGFMVVPVPRPPEQEAGELSRAPQVALR
jgi:hypothetical protein